MAEDNITFKKSGASSSKIPRFELIPYPSLVRVTRRYELGELNHKERAYNARANRQVLSDKEWLIARAAHAIHHAYKLIDKLDGRLEDDGDDDAAAIAWAGLTLCDAVIVKNAKRSEKMRRRNKKDK